jgi:hypothetical protein
LSGFVAKGLKDIDGDSMLDDRSFCSWSSLFVGTESSPDFGGSDSTWKKNVDVLPNCFVFLLDCRSLSYGR